MKYPHTPHPRSFENKVVADSQKGYEPIEGILKFEIVNFIFKNS